MNPIDKPGGSIGDPNMSVIPHVASLASLVSVFERNYGYDASHNAFFRQLIKGLLVADLGCGHGFSSFYLSTSAKRVVGFDIDIKALDYARATLRRLKVENVEFHLFDGYHTGFPSNYFGAVISADVIEHVHEPKLYLQEAFRICAQGGLMLISTPNGLIANGDPYIIRSHSAYHVTEYTPNQLVRMIEDVGFKLDHVLRQVKLESKVGLTSRFTRSILVIRDKLFSAKMVTTMNRLSFLFELKRMLRMTEGIDHFEIVESDINEISQSNCDAIVIVAHKGLHQPSQSC